MSIILPNLKHSFISPIPVPVPVPGSGFRIPDSGFPGFPYALNELLEFGLGMQATQTQIIQRTAKVKRKISCLKGPG